MTTQAPDDPLSHAGRLIVIAVGVPAWAASTLVGLLLTLGGGFSARYFPGRVAHTQIDLHATRESIRETVEWLKIQIAPCRRHDTAHVSAGRC